jgi:hypothetical protein
MTSNGLLEFGLILVVAVLPASLPMTLVGALIAARVTARQRHRNPLRYWIVRSCASGFALGALGSVLWFGGINASYMWGAGWDVAPAGMMGPGRREMLAFVSIAAFAGGVAGTLVGGAVGTYCWRVTRQLPPNDEMQLTSPA